MSLVEVTTPFLSLGPRVRVDGRVLTVDSRRLIWRRTVIFDGEARTITTRSGWLGAGTPRVFPFEAVRWLEYRYHDVATSFSRVRLGTVHDTLEWYTLSLVLDGEEHVRVGSFVGEGSRLTGVWGVLLRDSLLDARGSQTEDSLRLVDVLQRLLGVPLAAPTSMRAGVIRVCGTCRRAAGPGEVTCPCGGAFVVVR